MEKEKRERKDQEQEKKRKAKSQNKARGQQKRNTQTIEIGEQWPSNIYDSMVAGYWIELSDNKQQKLPNYQKE